MFDQAGVAAVPIEIPDGELTYWPALYSPARSRALLEALARDVPWRQEALRFGGKSYPQPRLTAWYGDPGAQYSYSGLSLAPLPWNETLAEVRQDIERLVGRTFNSALLNYYRDGQDSVGWHSDAEPELGRNPLIASLSLGATRKFALRHRKRKHLAPLVLELAGGSLLLMAGTTQHYWQHRVPRTRLPVSARINLTFRTIHPNRGAVAPQASTLSAGNPPSPGDPYAD